MEQDINITMEQFKYNIITTVNQNGLPIGITYYVLKDVFEEITAQYQRYINETMEKQRQEMEVAQSEDGSGLEQTIKDAVVEAVTEEIKDN